MRRSQLGHWWLLLGMLALAGAVAFGMRRYLSNSPAEPVSNSFAPLGLNIERSGNYLRVRWNLNHLAFRQAKQAVLSIVDGSKERRITIDSAEFTKSTVLYEPVSPNVTFKLTVRGDQNLNVSESVKVMAIPAPAEAERPRERKFDIHQRPNAPPRAEKPGTIHKVLPSVGRGARASIPSKVRIEVEMIVDSSGHVFSAQLNAPAYSAFFGRLALEAARKWKFPAGQEGTHLVRFEFTKEDVQAIVLGP